MGCVGSKQDEENDVVALCRERKRLLKLAVQSRYAFADAQCQYNQSLCQVAAAIRLFVARHSSPASPFLITFPSASESTETLVTTNPVFVQGRLSEPTSDRKSSYPSNLVHPPKDEDEEEDEEEEVLCEHFYDGVEVAPPPPPPQPLQRNLFWDFFDTFDGPRREEANGFSQSYGEDLGAVRGEEDREKVVQSVNNGNVKAHKKSGVEAQKKRREEANVSQGGGVKVIDTPTNGRELLEALKDVEDHFFRAHDTGLDISRMLESHRVKVQSGLEEIKESSNKLIRSVTRSRSSLSRSSSSRSLLSTSTSRNCSAWTDFKNDLFDDFGGMESGCHSLTLERLYAWEKKLYAEVKAGEEARKTYERKGLQTRSQKGFWYVNRTRVDAKDLYTRILVAVQCAESMSKRIQKLRDEELQPQLLELLHGLMNTWKIMSASHEAQKRIMAEVKSFNSPAYGNFRNDSHRLATLQLEAELRHWSSCFAAYLSTQRTYIEALHGWLSKFITPELEVYTRDWCSIPSQRINWPPLFVVCHDWLNSLKKLPDEGVTFSMKSFGKDLRALWVQQGEEQRQKRKVDELERELDKRVRVFQRAERRILESRISERDLLTGKKDLLDVFRTKLEAEKRKQHASVQETQRITVNGFQTGFSSVFSSLAEFSSASVRMYSDLISCLENAKAAKSQA